LLWRSWLAAPTPVDVHGPAAALELIEPWLPPVTDATAVSAPHALRLRSLGPGETRELTTKVGTYTLRALAANHDDARASDEPSTGSDVHRTSALVYLIDGPDGARVLYATDTARLPNATLAALTDTAIDVVFLDETFGTHYTHHTGHHDLHTFAAQLEELRSVGAATAKTDVVAVHLSHHNPPDVLARVHGLGARVVSDRTVIDTTQPLRGLVHLIVGGARSGKSLLAENIAKGMERAGQSVTYVATAPPQVADAEWDARIALHQGRRPPTWHTIETLDLESVLKAATSADAVVIDCLSLWVTGVLDAADAWASDAALDAAVTALQTRSASLLDALLGTSAAVVVVSNEVGQGVVPPTKSGRVFRDELGRLNASVANVATQVDFVVAGRALPLAIAFDHVQSSNPGGPVATTAEQPSSGATS
jgi:adenosylcobinamide kinase/adenosylcobinamide-phosphate guanylyltransferase